VLLTVGDRPVELRRAVSSVIAQRDVDVEVVVVVNGAEEVSVEGAKVVGLGRNVGIPAGRNVGVAATAGRLVCFLDDDGWFAGDDVLCGVSQRFAADDRLGILSLRLRDPLGRPGQRRHVPRLRVGDPARSSAVTTFLGGAAVIRRRVLEQVGGFPEEFFYAHEELSLAWRAIDAGWRVRYDGQLAVFHPSQPASRHPSFWYLQARNRVFLARRHLPALLAVVYVGLWMLISLARARSLGAAARTLRGFADGLRLPCGPRRPISWAAVWRMTQAGRPPLL
jgi:GT2 family glycosyltransferase